MMKQETDYTRLFAAIFLAAILMIGWQAMVEWPRRQALAKFQAEQMAVQKKEQEKTARITQRGETDENPNLTREQRIAASPRVAIKSTTLDGSIALKGARFDDLRLAKYRVSQEPGSPEVTLFSPNGDEHAYFAQLGWVSPDNSTNVPGHDSLWQADKKQLRPGEKLTLRWDNGEGVVFTLAVSLDDAYMFTIAQKVENRSGNAISVMPYGYINRAYQEQSQHYAILHEGPLGVLNNALDEVPYKTLREEGPKTFDDASGWFGITDKYWQAALIPGQDKFKTTFGHYAKGVQDRYQVDYLGSAPGLAAGASHESTVRLFAGAKEINVLDNYTSGDAAKKLPPIPLFDRSVDFGVLYFMTKPMFLTLNFFFNHIGNFGIAIMLLTIVIKLLMYPLANKSYHAAAQMRQLQPEVVKLRERYVDDKIRMNQEMMALYKREKVNPASGCVPVLIQMPVFFALYKVLFVTIEMRHAPFFGWLKDLSAADPSNLFTLFGLLPWSHPAWMHLGILPILMSVTMAIQMAQQPKPADPVQAKMIAFMPWFFLFIFASFPAGLVLYWVWSNILSILQQQLISSRHKKRERRGKKAKATA